MTSQQSQMAKPITKKRTTQTGAKHCFLSTTRLSTQRQGERMQLVAVDPFGVIRKII